MDTKSSIYNEAVDAYIEEKGLPLNTKPDPYEVWEWLMGASKDPEHKASKETMTFEEFKAKRFKELEEYKDPDGFDEVSIQQEWEEMGNTVPNQTMTVELPVGVVRTVISLEYDLHSPESYREFDQLTKEDYREMLESSLNSLVWDCSAYQSREKEDKLKIKTLEEERNIYKSFFMTGARNYAEYKAKNPEEVPF